MSIFQLIQITDPEDVLLPKVHDTILSRLFTNKNDLDSLDEIKIHLRRFGHYNNRLPRYLIFVLLEDKQVIGATVCGLFGYGDFCFIKGEYTGIVEYARKNGAFDFLCSQRIHMISKNISLYGFNKIDFIINELVSPEKIHGKENSMDTTFRLWKMKGFKKIDFEFIQLPLNKNKRSISFFDLYIMPLSDTYKSLSYLTAKQMKIIIDACQTFRVSDDNPEEYGEYQYMMEQLESKSQIRICTS